jgi:Zn-dependent protease
MEPNFQIPQQRPPPPPPSPRQPDLPPPQASGQRKGLLGVLGAIGVVLFKFIGPILVFAKTGGSMLLSIFAYSWAFDWGWPMATAIVFLIFVHEMGHVVAAWILGMPVTAPLFIPFIGASITMKENPRDAWTEALMAYGGPFAGCIGSWIALFVAIHIDANWLIGAASLSFVINLFNMIPVPPLDGGRICAAVSAWFWIIGLILLCSYILFFHRLNSLIILILVLVVAIPRLKQTLFGPGSPELSAYYNTHISNRLTMALMYLGLIGALLLGHLYAGAYLNFYSGQN